MNRTAIEWVKNPDGTQGYTWNPITGCLNGCSCCYARKLANGRLKARMVANRNLACREIPVGDKVIPVISARHFDNPFYPRLWQDRLSPLFPGGSDKGIFVCSMGDLFGIRVPEHWTRYILEKCKVNPQHRFYLLTKQPQNLAKWSPFPDNCWVGASVTNAQEQSDAYVGLGRIRATVKYLSYEPLLSNVSMEPQFLEDAGINWLIIGAQTKPLWLPEWSWVKEIIEAANDAGIPVFLKDSLGLPRMTADGSPPFYRKEIGTWVLRQEMPDA